MRVGWLLAGNILYVCLQWGVISVLSKQYGIEDVGRYFFALALAAPVFLFFSFKLPTLAVTKEARSSIQESLWSTRLLASTSALVVAVAFAAVFFSNEVSFVLVAAICVFKVLEHFDELESARYQTKMDFRSVFKIKVQRGFLYFALVSGAAFVFESITYALVSATAGYILLWFYLNRALMHSVKWSLTGVKQVVLLGWPLGLSVAVSSLVVSATRVYVGVVLGVAALAVFGAIGYAITAFTLLIAALGQYYLPAFVGAKSHPHRFHSLLRSSQAIVFLAGFFGALVSGLIGDFILRIAYNEDVAKHSSGLTIIIIATMFKASSALLGTSITATEKYTFQLKFSMLSAALLLVALPIMVEFQGIKGAFLALLIVSLIEWFAYLIFSFVYFKGYFNGAAKKAL